MSALNGDSDTPRGPQPRVLLVDDHPEVLRALRRFLKTSCDIVGEATSGHAALEVVTGLKPDVVVLDLAMPGLNGLEACRCIRQALPQTQVIILTATDDEDIRQAALDAGASALVLKHLAVRDLLNAIHNALPRELSRGQV
jgi:DNA-binding NarL/FixJ family response regulator